MNLSGGSCPTCNCAQSSCASCKDLVNCSNCVSCCCSSVHKSWRRSRIGTGVRIEYLSSAWMSVEVIGSVGLGFLSGSLALLAFGGDSLVELLSGFLVLSHLRTGAVSVTRKRRTELLTVGLLVALLPVIGLGAVVSYFSGIRPEASPLGIALAAGAIVIMPYLWYEKKRIGEETACLPLSIDALESVTCLFMAVALLGGLLAGFLLGLWWADYVATAFILAFVAKEAIESVQEINEE